MRITRPSRTSKTTAVSVSSSIPLPPPATELAHEHDDAVASVDELLSLQSALIPGLGVLLLERLPELRDAAQDLSFGKPPDCAMTLRIRIEQVRCLLPIPSQDGLDGAAHDLHVLLRHRSHSISRVNVLLP